VRASHLACAWTIIRPTTVWGPGHIGLADGLWRQMKLGRYFHPRGDAIVRNFGYVKNVAWQIHGLLLAERDLIDRRTFYVGDGNELQLDWVNAISHERTGHGVRTVPLWSLRTLAAAGDVFRALGLQFPLYGSRLRNMIAPNPVPVEPILDLLCRPPYTLGDGAQETVAWLRQYHAAGGRG